MSMLNKKSYQGIRNCLQHQKHFHQTRISRRMSTLTKTIIFIILELLRDEKVKNNLKPAPEYSKLDKTIIEF